MKRIIAFVVILFILFGLAAPALARTESYRPGWHILPAPTQKVSPLLQKSLDALASGETLTVIVQLRQRANLPEAPGLKRAERLVTAIDSLQETAASTQAPVKTFLQLRSKQGGVTAFTPFWIFNGFSVTADAATIEEIAARPDVLSVTPDAIDIVSLSSSVSLLNNPEPNITLTGAPSLWNLGYTGQGVVLASLDSGVDMNHPELSGRWRGGTNSWFDPYGQHPDNPVDRSGHGTWTMGVMLGGDAGGTSVGVAPGAQWIAARVFNDQGSSTATAIHQAYQWVLDPDNNPATADAPQVVNNSWAFGAPGCNLEFEPDLQALRAAGILPVFAAGNSGPNTGTSHSPANNPSAFAVGAINNSSTIYGLSSRGPTDCGSSTGVFPELVAPGVNVVTTDLGGFYTTSSGTSLAAPHVSAGLALLLSAYPNMPASHQESALLASAFDLGVAGPDDTYGYGRLDLLVAYQWLATAPTETPAPTATATALPSQTATPLPTNTATALPSPTPTSTAAPANSTGWLNSTRQVVITSGGDGNGYEVNAINAYANDGLFAMDMDSGTGTSTGCGNSGKDRHKYLNYNISVPAGATVQGIEVRLDAKADSTVGAPKVCVSLSWNAASSWSAWKSTSTLTTSEAAYILGSPTDTWGHTWTSSELSNTSFQVRVTDVASDTTRDFSLDWIAVNVTFSSGAPASATPTATNPAASPTPTFTATVTNTPTATAIGPTATFTSTAVASSTPTPTASPTNSPSSSVYFSTYGNTNPPGVSGTADNADIYLFNGSAFSRGIDASGTGSLLGLPSGANVDGFDGVDSTHFYLTFNGNVTVPGLGTVQDEDVLFYNAGAWSVFFDGTAYGLSATDLDAISVVGDLLYFSTDNATLPPGAGGSADDADIYRWNGGGSYTRIIDAAGSGSLLGLPSGADVDGYVRVDAGNFYLSFNADVNVPGLGTVQDEDILYYDNGTWSVYFDGTANGLTASSQDVDAFDLP